ncbi:MAG: HIT domain-containing protein [Nitrospirae bacterium]|nr:HIT domain-containing protein [Nitrospirota bacterium]MBI5694562.1 HIT domain-containing protein [Nitrospirota bacterium]
MKRLWAPWRLEYILAKKEGGCVFCAAVDEDDDAKNYILHRAERCFVIMNIYPYNNGHMMVIPYEHVEDLESLPDETLAEMTVMTKHCCTVMRDAMNPHGFNIGANVGDAAGAGIKEHLHFHIVPRWHGDTNYMAVIDDCRVMPQHLRESFDQMKPGFAKLFGGK